ncbi:hypothetical protein ACFHYO_11750 [Paracoccus panacisoli]|uniref:Uncharacterized protein n=2 Tax=Paracoccus TaxID=265 RepID=A0A1H2WVW6_9RHOB|nr:hypothetical protein [Paracoccus sanguinis]SDW84384.1 hypothetical protein SAMN05444276_102280 [Paracoccus sanguinis]
MRPTVKPTRTLPDLPDALADMLGVAAIGVATLTVLWLPALAGV